MPMDRRRFLQLSAAAAGSSPLWPQAIAKALQVAPAHVSGSLDDVKHVVILMQENRSFDHYFGSLRGVRGFGDPRPLQLRNGAPVWQQPLQPGSKASLLPFHLDSRHTRAQCMDSLNHDWKGSHQRWQDHDAWIAQKTPMTMGYFNRSDLPFYYALADAFTICDGYHASLFGPTNPNRLFLFSGTSGLSVGQTGRQVVENVDDGNWTADMGRDHPDYAGLTWCTYAERLEQAGVSWKLYQEYDNYGDNALQSFAAFRQLDPNSARYQRGRAWAAGSNASNAANTLGQPLVDAFRSDIAAGKLPSVSWLVAPYAMCEHPKASPGYGESLVSRLLEALADHPETWSKTVFLINYDENDGLFDHIPPAIPPIHAELGQTNLDMRGETYQGVPVGFGIRVPMLVISPWSRGGWVNSQLFDHTSVIRLLEQRFGVVEPNISPWRRSLAGDLTSTLDFSRRDSHWPNLPTTADTIRQTQASYQLASPHPPLHQIMPVQEPGQRPACALPYAFSIKLQPDPQGQPQLLIDNRSQVGIALNAYAHDDSAGPWFYSLSAHSQMQVAWPSSHSNKMPVAGLDIYGPNGFLRQFKLSPHQWQNDPITAIDLDPRSQELLIELYNPSHAPIQIWLDNHYARELTQSCTVAAGSTAQLRVPLQMHFHWYDISLRCPELEQWGQRLAGHIETGKASMSDPMIGVQRT